VAGETRFPLYLHNQLSYHKMETTIRFSASNRSRNLLERDSHCSWKASFTGRKTHHGRSRKQLWRLNQGRYGETEAIIVIATSNRCNYLLERCAYGSLGPFARASKKNRDNRTRFRLNLPSEACCR